MGVDSDSRAVYMLGLEPLEASPMILAIEIGAVLFSVFAAIVAIVIRRREEADSPENRELFSAADLRQPRRHFAR